MIRTSRFHPAVLLQNAIHRPSGDHAGSRPSASSSRRARPDATFTTQSSLVEKYGSTGIQSVRLVLKATSVPSGDQVG
jgi:hypothetical protein